MKKSFLLEITLLSVCCANVNNASCDCCRFCKEKKFIAKALGIKKDDIWFIQEFKGKNAEAEFKTFSDKQGEDFKNRVENSHEVILIVINVDNSGEPKEDDGCFFYAYIDKEKNINPSSELLDKKTNVDEIVDNNKGKKVKIVIVKKHGESGEGTTYFCKKN